MTTTTTTTTTTPAATAAAATFFSYLQIYREQFCKRVSDNKDGINNNLAE